MIKDHLYFDRMLTKWISETNTDTASSMSSSPHSDLSSTGTADNSSVQAISEQKQKETTNPFRK
jgi:hypothetical protein